MSQRISLRPLNGSRRPQRKGSAKDYWRLGLCYDEGQGVTKNPEEVFKWFKKAANKGHLTSQVRIGLSYIEGKGVERDELRGHAWILIAAAEGSEAAQSYRDLLDEHIEQDQIAKAQKLADEIMGANVDLAGDNYIPPAEEVDLYRRAAEEGHVDSMLALGMLLRDGAGVEKDSEQAALWFKILPPRSLHRPCRKLKNANVHFWGKVPTAHHVFRLSWDPYNVTARSLSMPQMDHFLFPFCKRF